jgi:hypothetical protein
MHDLFTGIAGMVISIGANIKVYVAIANLLIVIYISWTILQRYNKILY